MYVMQLITEILLIILCVMSFGLLIYSHIEFMKTVREADKAIEEADRVLDDGDDYENIAN